MCDTKYEHPFIYLLEFHIGDGYFDRQSVGEYSVLVTYRDGSTILVKEKERGDDRLVKFRQGKSIIFGINKPRQEMKIIFQAIDNHEKIGKAKVYFSGTGAPNLLATNSTTSPKASVIRTNVLLSHGAGSLQVFARLTCFGLNLLTEFSVSGKVNTEFDVYVSDIELTAEESMARCNFDSGDDMKANEESEIVGKRMAQKNVEHDTLHYLMSDMKLTNENSLGDRSLCFYEASYIAQDDSYDLLKDTMEKKNEDFESIRATLHELVNEATILGEANVASNCTDTRQIRNLDDLMFTNFIPLDEFTSHEEILVGENDFKANIIESKLTLSADASLLDIKLQDSIYNLVENELRNDEGNNDEVCIEPKIGDAPASINVVTENSDKSEDEIEDTDDSRPVEIPCETGDAPTTSSGTDSITDEQISTKLGQKRKKHNQKDSGKKDQINEENPGEKSEQEQTEKLNISQAEITKRKYAKGKRRGNCHK